MNANYDFYSPANVLFGRGRLNELHTCALPGRRAAVVVSRGKSVKANGYLSRVERELATAGVEAVVFDRIQANPLKSTVEEGAEFVRGAQCDFIVALGGGSVMDASKGIALLATNDGDLWDYVGMGTGKGRPITVRPLPIVAITTTAGTGSEVDAGGVITNEETHEKTAILDPSLIPVLAIVDAELTRSVPPAFTAYQGFDALFHSTEGYLNRNANFMGDMVSLTAIEHVSGYLARAVRDGDDLEAREHVLFGNTMSGYSMVAAGCISEHSLEHALSAYHQELPHGAGLIMISLAYYGVFVERHVADERFVRMAQAMGKADATRPEDFLTALADLQRACGVDSLKMSDYGITEAEFGVFADNAFSAMGALFESDPAPLSRDDCVDIYQRSFR